MSIAKRVLALAAASATALVLGGVLSTTHQATRVDAAGPTATAIGCANSNNANDIVFFTTIGTNGNGVGGLGVGGNLLNGANSNGNGAGNFNGNSGNGFFNNQATTGIATGGAAGSPTFVGGTLSVLNPLGAVECGAVFQDTTTVPAAGFLGAQDADPNTIDGGTITYNLQASTAVAQILESNSSSFAVNCGSAQPPTGTATVGAGAAVGVAQVSTITLTGATGGTFTLTFNGQTTAPIAFNAAPAAVQAALAVLPAIVTAGGVTVTSPNAAGGPFVITFTNVGPQGQITVNGAGLTPVAAAAQTLTVTQTAAGAAPANPASYLIQVSAGTTGGTFTLTFGGFTTAALPFNATGAAIAAALNAGTGTTGVVFVAGQPGVAANNPGGTGLSAFTAAQVLNLGGATGGALVLIVNGVPTAGIPIPATAAQIAAALNALPNVILAGGVTVTQPGGAGTPFFIAFNNPAATLPITAFSGGLTPAGSVATVSPNILATGAPFPPITGNGAALTPIAVVGATAVAGITTAGVAAAGAGATVFAITNPGGLESCQGGVPTFLGAGNVFGAGLLQGGNGAGGNGTFGGVSPTVANLVHVAFRTGATFGAIGTATPVVTISATYNRFPGINSAVFTNGAGVVGVTPIAQGPSNVTTASAVINIALPVYAMTLTPSPATISAASGTGSGSTITAALFRQVNTNCVPLALGSGFAICTAASGAAISINSATNFIAGSEPGVITFTTSSGVFGSTSGTPGAFAQQIFSTHCGAIPGTAPLLLLPTFGSPIGSSISLASCLTATAQLFGGGAAGTATVTADFVGDFTGASASIATTVAFSPVSATVNLSRGCNEVITPASVAAGATVQTVVGLVQGTTVVSVWRFNNSTKAFEAGFFSTAGAPTDFSTTGPSVSLFICVSGSGTFPTGAF